MTRQLSDFCSLDVESKEFKVRLLVNNISQLKVREPKVAGILRMKLDNSHIKRRLSLFKKMTL